MFTEDLIYMLHFLTLLLIFQVHKELSRAYLNSNLGSPVTMTPPWRPDSFLCFVSVRAYRQLLGN